MERRPTGRVGGHAGAHGLAQGFHVEIPHKSQRAPEGRVVGRILQKSQKIDGPGHQRMLGGQKAVFGHHRYAPTGQKGGQGACFPPGAGEHGDVAKGPLGQKLFGKKPMQALGRRRFNLGR